MGDKRRQLIDHAIGLFTRHGVISVTMDDVAAAAGVSKRTVYEFFSNKALLVEAVVGLLIEKSGQISSLNKLGSADPVQELVLQQDLFKQWIAWRIILNAMMLKRFPKALKAFHDFKSGHLKLVIQTNLSAGIAKGYYRPDLNVHGTAEIYLSVTDHFVFRDLKNHTDVFEALLLFINGITTSSGRGLLKKYSALFDGNPNSGPK